MAFVRALANMFVDGVFRPQGDVFEYSGRRNDYMGLVSESSETEEVNEVNEVNDEVNDEISVKKPKKK